jgi:hypothetical protein
LIINYVLLYKSVSHFFQLVYWWMFLLTFYEKSRSMTFEGRIHWIVILIYDALCEPLILRPSCFTLSHAWKMTKEVKCLIQFFTYSALYSKSATTVCLWYVIVARLLKMYVCIEDGRDAFRLLYVKASVTYPSVAANHTFNNTFLRIEFVQGSICQDIMCMSCCGCLSLMQLHRELKTRGYWR